ncbi:MAG: hypothetical protein WD871_12170 [Xanthobacteraceae bacterium]
MNHLPRQRTLGKLLHMGSSMSKLMGVMILAVTAAFLQEALAQNAGAKLESECKGELAALDARFLTTYRMSVPYRQAYIDKKTEENRAAFCKNNVLFASEVRAIIADFDKKVLADKKNCASSAEWKKYPVDMRNTLKQSTDTAALLCKQ